MSRPISRGLNYYREFPDMMTNPMGALSKIRIDKHDPGPVYLQIAGAIKELLRTGQIAAGTAMPPERVLAQQFGVSRMTMRQANDILERQGLIERHAGRGTLAVEKRSIKQEQETRRISAEFRRRGGIPLSRLISNRTIAASASAAELFAFSAGEPLYEIERVRRADGVPIAFEAVQIPARL